MAEPTVWIFEDQLTHDHPALKAHPAAPVLLIESDRHYRGLPFHKHRIVFLVSAMRHFAAELRARGRTVHHYGFTAKNYRDSLSALRHCIKATASTEFVVAAPSEYHTAAWLRTLPELLGVRFETLDNTLFLTARDEFSAWVRPLKAPVMETFYRRMRVTHGVLMNHDRKTPLGGEWNLDKLNRKPAPKNLLIPPLPMFAPDETTRAVMAEVARRFPTHPGTVEGFALPVTREQSLAALKDFIKNRLPLFGDYEDAMLTGQPVLFHSFLSPQLNAGLLSPMECVRAAEAAHSAGKVELNSAEGFVRQILGWREYVYGIYWSFMPEYRDRNHRGSSRPLPNLLWDADTDMNCLKQTVSGLIEHAYTHHIQRLMVLCNFATLAGLSPQAMNDWFYAMYADAHDWVVTPNVVGMGMNADAAPANPSVAHRGTIATKPYISSGAYIDRMSDYCAGCRYDVGKRTGEDACPFNYLFWTFLHHHCELYARNPRMTMMLKNAEKIAPTEMREMMLARKAFLEGLPTGGYPTPRYPV